MAAEDIYVYLAGEEMIDCQVWNGAIKKSGFSLSMHPFDTEDGSGTVTCQLEGINCAFEYYYEEVEEEDDLNFDIIGDRDFVVTLTPANSGKALLAAIIAAGVLADRTDGIIYDCNSRTYVESPAAIEWVQNSLAS